MLFGGDIFDHPGADVTATAVTAANPGDNMPPAINAVEFDSLDAHDFGLE
jgi:hypothetical protein